MTYDPDIFLWTRYFFLFKLLSVALIDLGLFVALKEVEYSYFRTISAS